MNCKGLNCLLKTCNLMIFSATAYADATQANRKTNKHDNRIKSNKSHENIEKVSLKHKENERPHHALTNQYNAIYIDQHNIPTQAWSKQAYRSDLSNGSPIYALFLSKDIPLQANERHCLVKMNKPPHKLP